MSEGMITGLSSPSGSERMSCQESPYLSCTQPKRSLKGYFSKGISAVPPSDNLSHILSRLFLASGSLDGSKFTKNDTDGLNLNKGPALIAMKDCPASSKETISESPDGVSWSVVIFVTFESGNKEV